MARYMDKEKAESAKRARENLAKMQKENAECATRNREHLAKYHAYQQHEKGRTQVQCRMHDETEKAMSKLRAETVTGNREHVAKHRAYEKTLGKEF